MSRLRLHWRHAVVFALIAMALAAGATAGNFSSPAPTVARTCYDNFASVTRITVNDRTDVDLSCGDRLLVDGERCLVQRGPELTVVPCIRPNQTVTVGR